MLLLPLLPHCITCPRSRISVMVGSAVTLELQRPLGITWSSDLKTWNAARGHVSNMETGPKGTVTS